MQLFDAASLASLFYHLDIDRNGLLSVEELGWDETFDEVGSYNGMLYNVPFRLLTYCGKTRRREGGECPVRRCRNGRISGRSL